MEIAAVATGSQATVFLKNQAMWGNPWILLGFDHVQMLTGPTEVTSVGAAKALNNDSVVRLTGDVVVTYISGTPSDYENAGKPYIYVQDEDGTAGIKVTMAHDSLTMPALTVGQRFHRWHDHPCHLQEPVCQDTLPVRPAAEDEQACG
jgi:hypothetical protein